MARGKRKTKRSDHMMIDDRIAVLYGGCSDIGDESDEIASPFLQTGMRPTFCRHWRQQVEIEPGVVVHASAYMDRPRTDDWEWPEIGIYLSERWIEEMPMASFHWAGPTLGPSSQVALLPCPDGGWPLYEKETEQVLAYALEAARAGRFVEVGCHAGHGRTGIALAALMILAGQDTSDAMTRVWTSYCEQAIETVGQERYLVDFALSVRKEER
ncbi:MAG: hypothetical protein LC808_24130 [Actinobacteria bacterium]|nr:hypothetical protein [Actinomycetota bacterium]